MADGGGKEGKMGLEEMLLGEVVISISQEKKCIQGGKRKSDLLLCLV